uniref:Kunitz-type trypsin inhibitor KTI1 n=1 Tax=Noccaea caerulescens TaxID=107243 RepID=A0A1J3K3F4_NOCCA
MKPTMSLTLIFLVVALATPILARPDGHVKDSVGRILRPGQTYHIVPATPETGGGLFSNSEEICPLDILQSKNPLDLGLPIKLNSELWFVKEFNDVTIEFEAPNWFLCPEESKGWRVVYSEEFKKSLVISSGGSSNPSRFQIHRVEGDAYKIVYCTNMSPTTCTNVGIFTDLSGVRRLVLTNDEALLVKFQKARDHEPAKSDLKTKLRMFPSY